MILPTNYTNDYIDIIIQILDGLKNVFIIIDEFHNLSKNNITNKYDKFNKVLHTKNKMLLMSATPRVYELENDGDDVDLGEVVYKMSFKEAIDIGILSDYRIITLFISNEEVKRLIEQNALAKIYNSFSAPSSSFALANSRSVFVDP